MTYGSVIAFKIVSPIMKDVNKSEGDCDYLIQRDHI